MKITQDKERQKQCTVECIAWLHHVWEITERGEVIPLDPFYARNDLITEAVVKNVIGDIEDLFKKEIKNYPGYHNQAQGISAGEVLVVPAFDKLSYQQQKAIVQGIDKIFQSYRVTEPASEPEYDPSIPG